MICVLPSLFAQNNSNFPFTINETWVNDDGCSMTMAGSGVVTVEFPPPGSSDVLTASASGTVTFTFGSGCGDMSGVSFSISFNCFQTQGNPPSLSGTDQTSQAWLNAHPAEKARLVASVTSHFPF